MGETRQPSFDEMSIDLPEAGAWPPARAAAPAWRGKRKPLPPELAEFQRRAAQAGLRSAASQARKLRSVWEAACRRLGLKVSVRQLFLDPDLLAAAASDPVRLDGRGNEQLTTATLAYRRVAVRTFFRLMENVLGRDADFLIRGFEDALRELCELAGQKYRLRAGRSCIRRSYTPTAEEIQALIHHASGSRVGHCGRRNGAFIGLLRETGLRVSSAVSIDGADFYRAASGLFVFVREKCGPEPASVCVSRELEALLVRYVARFNGCMAGRGSPERIGIGAAGSFWRRSDGGPWDVTSAIQMIRKSSGRFCSRAFGPHAIRHFRATELVGQLPRSVVAKALRWRSVRTLDKHYGPPPGGSASWDRRGRRTSDRRRKSGDGSGDNQAA